MGKAHNLALTLWSRLKRERPVIGVDVDSTLYDFLDVYFKVGKEHYGVSRPAHLSEWETCFSVFNSIDDALSCVLKTHSDENILSSIPFVGAPEVLQKLSEKYEIHYFTDRSSDAHKATHEWLKLWGFPDADNLMCTKDKREDMVHLWRRGRLKTIIDDRPRTIIWARYALGLPSVFSLKMDYNRGFSDIEGVYLADTWDELYQIMSQQSI